MEPFPELDPARVCLQNNILVYLVEYLKDCKRKNMIEEGSRVIKEAMQLNNYLSKLGFGM